MKKPIKVILIILGLFLASFLGLYFLLFGNHATTPDTIARKVGLRLPAHEIVKAEDNMDRTASAWSYYSYEIKFKEPLSEAYLHKVEKLQNCIHDGDTYMEIHILYPRNRLIIGQARSASVPQKTRHFWNTTSGIRSFNMFAAFTQNRHYIRF